MRGQVCSVLAPSPQCGAGGAVLQGLCRGRSHLPVSAGPSVALEGALARSLLSDQTGSTGSFPPAELLMTLPYLVGLGPASPSWPLGGPQLGQQRYCGA